MPEADSPVQPDNCDFLDARNLILSKPCPHCQGQGRPKDCDLPNEAITWRWLKESSADLDCPIAAFQSQFQSAFTSCAQGRLPSFYRSLYRSRDRVGTATQNDKLGTALNTGTEPEIDAVPPKFVHQSAGAKIFEHSPAQSLAMPEKILSTRASN